ncbi:PREDICTED: leukocyte receptor cluster member 1 isoform X2 [Capra hircus]|uniref:leukocyte receptor cluster member 1 isoform X2 n=1 Tax=Capra hircus TaxID=9925 RepID=UPI000847C6C2|nr:PREDICTED: leukocyte receptor cluster member 1 isoform X2 [Capra hircus]
MSPACGVTRPEPVRRRKSVSGGRCSLSRRPAQNSYGRKPGIRTHSLHWKQKREPQAVLALWICFGSCWKKERQEKALGILTYLGQSAAEAQTQPPWYQLPPRPGGPASGPGPDERIKSRLDPLREMREHLGKKRKHSGDSGGHSAKEKKAPEKRRPKEPPSLEQLRADRLRREAAERARAEALLARVGGTAAPEEQPEEVDERRRRYNSQFNPQLARRPRRQDPPAAP